MQNVIIFWDRVVYSIVICPTRVKPCCWLTVFVLLARERRCQLDLPLVCRIRYWTRLLQLVQLAWQEAFYGKEITLADRNVVESEADSIYSTAREEDVSFLVVGDPLCATTHTDLIIRARELGIKVRELMIVAW